MNEYCSCTRDSTQREAKEPLRTPHNNHLPTSHLPFSLPLPVNSTFQCYLPACSSDQSHEHPCHGHSGNLSQTPRTPQTQKETIDITCATLVQILNHAAVTLQMEKQTRLLVDFPTQRNRRRERTLRLDTVHIADESVVFLFSQSKWTTTVWRSNAVPSVGLSGVSWVSSEQMVEMITIVVTKRKGGFQRGVTFLQHGCATLRPENPLLIDVSER